MLSMEGVVSVAVNNGSSVWIVDEVDGLSHTTLNVHGLDGPWRHDNSTRIIDVVTDGVSLSAIGTDSHRYNTAVKTVLDAVYRNKTATRIGGLWDAGSSEKVRSIDIVGSTYLSILANGSVWATPPTALFPASPGPYETISSDGTFTCATKQTTKTVYCVTKTMGTWLPLGGKLTQLSLRNGRLFGIGSNGTLWTTTLQETASPDKSYQAVDDQEKADEAALANQPPRVVFRSSKMRTLPTPAALAKISFDGKKACGVTSSFDVYCVQHGSNDWQKQDERLKAISVEGSSVYAIDTNDKLVWRDTQRKNASWTALILPPEMASRPTQIKFNKRTLCIRDFGRTVFCAKFWNATDLEWWFAAGKMIEDFEVADGTIFQVAANEAGLTYFGLPKFPALNETPHVVATDGDYVCAAKRDVYVTLYSKNELTDEANSLRSPFSTEFGMMAGSGFNDGILADWAKDEGLQAMRIPLNDLQLGQRVSRGAFGDVYKGRYNGQIVAIKVLAESKRRNLTELTKFAQEARFMAMLQHDHIARFVGVAWNTPSDLCIVAEFLAGGDVRALLQRYLSEGRPEGFSPEKIKIALHVAHALTYLHSLQPIVLHRDLKSKNILLTEEGDAKLTDFGVSRVIQDATMTVNILLTEEGDAKLTDFGVSRVIQDATMTVVGSSLWMAPEVIQGERYDEKADVYSFGVVLSELDTNELPFADVQRDGVVIECEDNARGSERKRLPEVAILQLVMQGSLSVRFSENADSTLAEIGRATDPED
ncbi:hypothetical protein P43SY_000491 [Pythium insidiosum]|uniref:Protein kinase domain-containing protein n=1 Tax=Pythium insidiosum TaxID=114742 RepID=A0AAD5LIZ4_PYTIN|nr:hypothetical protein P43SY_000491 [Pythium insidiosum]